MASTDHIAKAETTIHASPADTWKALTDPGMINKYMFGTTVTSDWKEGSTITWKGEWEGKHYEDKGKILRMELYRQLQYGHFSPMSGADDVPENYHIVTIDLNKKGNDTTVTLTQTNNGSEEAKDHSEKNWKMMLDSLKKLLEEQN
jgi:uncharacterized protein YndB with AHSA1/START domain